MRNVLKYHKTFKRFGAVAVRFGSGSFFILLKFSTVILVLHSRPGSERVNKDSARMFPSRSGEGYM